MNGLDRLARTEAILICELMTLKHDGVITLLSVASCLIVWVIQHASVEPAVHVSFHVAMKTTHNVR